ncbi:hypothetical protein OEA41_008813 [Lepraria neglecta]|uniref:UV excision repair protein RAD23 n=1 Tax=Lepraria neglecta TaxID=209136 RepID=A0AAD9Z0P1_9LECA|nr:hypothetical protein OEA41_008813 [Lepraria neglecta]
MKLTFKDLKQQKFVIEAEPSETIGEVKEKISKEKGWEASQQKLIYSGKILQDANTVESYSIEEKGFIVCMISKRDDAISNMQAMGFPRAEIDRAMRAAFFNPDRAVEYLLNGIPENVQQEQAQAQARGGAGGARQGGTPAAASPPAATGNTPAPAAGGDDGDQPINLFEAAAQAGRTGGAGGGARGSRGAAGGANLAGLGAGIGAAAGAGAEGGAGLGNLDFLRNNPQFQQLRQIVQTQPRMLEPILQQVGAGNPQLARLIGENPDQFLQLLSEDTGDDTPLPPGAQEISVTEEEREAIERLCRLGFERDMVIQAYFACDKNEELAANFLFDQPDDEGEGGA